MDSYTKYEIEAHAFNLMTGHLAPGKDLPPAAGPSDYEERARASINKNNKPSKNMHRTTQAELESLVARLNRITDSPTESYTKQADGRFKANIGNYHLDGAYGGYSLHRMMNEGGGITDVLRVGHVSKRELYHLIHAFIAGLDAQPPLKTEQAA